MPPLFPFITTLSEKYEFVLASASPRRKEILSKLGIPLTIHPSTFPETLEKSTFPTPQSYATTNAHEKASEVYKTRLNTSVKQPFVIAADTIVVDNNIILEKPADKNHAMEMMKQLSGKEHKVCTAVVCIYPSRDSKDPVIKSFIEETIVTFAELPEDWIEAYIATEDPYDKAGGYGYQSLAAMFIPKIDGCYYNVVGFPLYRFLEVLKNV